MGVLSVLADTFEGAVCKNAVDADDDAGEGEAAALACFDVPCLLDDGGGGFPNALMASSRADSLGLAIERDEEEEDTALCEWELELEPCDVRGRCSL